MPIQFIITIIFAFKNLLNSLIFWVDNEIVKLILVSILTMNITRFYSVKRNRWQYLIVKCIFTIYSIGYYYGVYLQTILSSWDFMFNIAVIPIVIAGIFLGSKIYPKLKKYLRYEVFHFVYSIIAIIVVIIEPSGYWSALITLIYSIGLFLLSNWKYGK